MRQAWWVVSWWLMLGTRGDGGVYEFRLVDHRSEDEFGTANNLVEGSPMEFGRLGGFRGGGGVAGC